jgi:hypothetical protein
MKKSYLLFCYCAQLFVNVFLAQSSEIKPRMRVIVDNDFSGDPDGLFQMAHLLLSPRLIFVELLVRI